MALGPSSSLEPMKNNGPDDSLRFSTVNAVLGVLGLLCLVGGYALLDGGSITAAPLLLVVGYVVLLPLAIIR